MNYGNYGYTPTYQSQQRQMTTRAGYTDVIYATEQQAEMEIVYPNNKVLFLITDKPMLITKSSDINGFMTIEKYNIEKIPNGNENTQYKANDGVKTQDLSQFITSDKMDEKLKEFKTDFDKKLADLKKSISISAQVKEIIKREENGTD